MSDASQKPKKYEERLMDKLDFDEHDLEANQAGHFSQQQIYRLRRARYLSTSEIGSLVFLGVIVCAFILGLGIGAESALPLIIIGLAALAIFYNAYSSKARLLPQDLAENRVSVIEGRVDLLITPRQNSAEYFIVVEKMKLPVKKRETFLAFKNGDPYRIYYAPHSKRILSAEWLRDDENPFVEDVDSAAQASDNASTPTSDQQTPSRQQ